MVIILNLFEFENGCSRKFKIITISNTDHIASLFNLYLNPCTYLETAVSNLSYTAFSVSKVYILYVYEYPCFVNCVLWIIFALFKTRVYYACFICYEFCKYHVFENTVLDFQGQKC